MIVAKTQEAWEYLRGEFKARRVEKIYRTLVHGFMEQQSGRIVAEIDKGGTPTVNAVLGVGSLEESVTVEAGAPLVDVRSTGISTVVDNEAILELPLQGRQVTDLIVLAGAAVQTGLTARGVPGGVYISVAGGLPGGVAYTLDGAEHNNPQSNAGLPMPFPDALQEIEIESSGDINITATGKINVDAKSEAKVTAPNISVEAKAKLELKAAQISIAGNAQVKISAPMVQIN